MRSCSGLMGSSCGGGLGAVPADDQAPVRLDPRASTDPIYSTASVMASSVMTRMAAMPRAQRANEMVSILNAAKPGLGPVVRADYMRTVQRVAPNQKDQAMFDAITRGIANLLVERTLSMAPQSVSGLGQTIAEATGRTSSAVNDANALFCSFGAGTGAMVSGLLAQFNTGGSRSTAGVSAAETGGRIAGCGAGQLVLQNQAALAQAQLSQSAAAQAALAQQAASDRMFKMVLAALGIGVVGLIGYKVATK